MSHESLFGDRGSGLVWSHPGYHLAYGWGHGALLWAPNWVKDSIVSVWNWIVCHTLGHAWFGPWDEEDGTYFIDGIWTRTYPQTCSACSKVVWRWDRKRPRRLSRTLRHRQAIQRAWNYRRDRAALAALLRELRRKGKEADDHGLEVDGGWLAERIDPSLAGR